MKKFKQILKMASVSMMLIALMACSMFMVSAVPAPAALTDGGTATDPAEALLQKALRLPVGVDVPASTFTFEFEAVTVDGIAANVANNMPEIDDAEIEFTSSFDPADSSAVPTDVTVTTVAGVVTVKKDSATDILDGIDWPHAGEYVYTVTETVGTASFDGEMTYSTESYQMTVYVVNVVDASGNPDLNEDCYVKAVGFKKSSEVDPDDDSKGKAIPVFTNQYTITTELEVSKEVKGEYADTTKDFNFTITMIKSPFEETPATGSPVTYTGTVYDENGAVSPSTTFSVTHTDTSFGGTFKLKHGQYIVFEDLPAGTTYTLSEALTANNEQYYTPTVELTVNDGTPAPEVAVKAASDNVYTIGGATPINLGEGDNFAAWTNTHRSVSPTGILLNNLPFILLILAAIGGFIWFIIAKRRKASKSR